jgi:hypothetical protein
MAARTSGLSRALTCQRHKTLVMALADLVSSWPRMHWCGINKQLWTAQATGPFHSLLWQRRWPAVDIIRGCSSAAAAILRRTDLWYLPGDAEVLGVEGGRRQPPPLRHPTPQRRRVNANRRDAAAQPVRNQHQAIAARAPPHLLPLLRTVLLVVGSGIRTCTASESNCGTCCQTRELTPSRSVSAHWQACEGYRGAT